MTAHADDDYQRRGSHEPRLDAHLSRMGFPMLVNLTIVNADAAAIESVAIVA